jgi:predicted dehydrogenase
VTGAGAFGRNHLRVLRELENEGAGAALVAAVEPDAARAEETRKQFGIPVFAGIDELLKADLKLDAACVAVPTVKHYEAASQMLDAGLDLLIEKPIAATLAEADALIQSQKKNNRAIQVGHLERFNPAVIAVEPKLKRPMFFEAHRLSVYTPRSLDVDVVLDLMIHDLDIVLTFARSSVREVRAVGLPVVSPKVDIANVRVEFDSGCVANFTASRVSTEKVRKLRFFEPRQYVSIDYARRDLLVIRMDGDDGAPADERVNELLHALPSHIRAMVPRKVAEDVLAGKIDAATIAKYAGMMGVDPAIVAKFTMHTGPAPGLSFVNPEVTPGEPLKLELLSFLDAVRTRREPRVTAEQGRAALELALTIQAQMAAHADRAGLGDFFKGSR